jgi:hypothetical protein
MQRPWYFSRRLWITVLCLSVLLLHFAFAAAAGPRFDSAYTDLAKACRAAFDENEVEEGQDIPSRCDGPAHLSLYIDYSAMHAHLRVEDADGHDLLENAVTMRMDDVDRGKVEWRMADSVPFAVIVRVRDGDGDAGTQTLEVRGIGTYRDLSASVDANGNAKANIEARALADRARQAMP